MKEMIKLKKLLPAMISDKLGRFKKIITKFEDIDRIKIKNKIGNLTNMKII